MLVLWWCVSAFAEVNLHGLFTDNMVLQCDAAVPVWGAAVINGDRVIVSSPGVLKPVAVRYAWQNFPLCNLYNTEGLPAVPFRTDRFEVTAKPTKEQGVF